MDFLATLAIVVLFSWLLRRRIHSHPYVFYALAIACNALLLANAYLPMPRWVLTVVSPLMQKGGLGVAFFLLVMWIGVFPRDSKLSRGFRPIRAELSLMACILIVGHMYVYLTSYMPRIVIGSAPKDSVVAALAIAYVMLALMIPLAATSLRAVKRRMKAHTWRKVQSLAYAFYGLILIHLVLMLGPSAMAGSERSMVMVVLYIIMFGGYVVARIVRAIVDRKEHVDLAETVKDQGFRA